MDITQWWQGHTNTHWVSCVLYCRFITLSRYQQYLTRNNFKPEVLVYSYYQFAAVAFVFKQDQLQFVQQSF